MNVLSLFDGISCGQIALRRAGIEYDNYFASETDKYAIQTTQKNYPDTIQLGNVTKIKAEDLPKIDLVIGGSPCQGFSSAGKFLNFDDNRSKLFFEFIRLLKDVMPKYFVFENVKMKREWKNIISKFLEVEPIELNSSLVSAQSRKRFYWTNIQGIKQPEDKGIYLKDILENNVDEIYSIKTPKPDFKGLDTEKKGKTLRCSTGRSLTDKHNCDVIKLSVKGHLKQNQNKASCLMGGGHSGGNHSDMDVIVQKSHGFNSGGIFKDKSPTLLSNSWEHNNHVDNGYKLRRLTPVECERLQTVPDNYTEGVSNTQRYKMLGNAFTVDVIVHILNNIK